jgi:tetratricopeptide (TPR) repeat protein
MRAQSGRLSAKLRRARNLSASGDYSGAETCLRLALKSAQGTNDPAARPILWNDLGMVCKYSGKFDFAQRYYHLALQGGCRCFQGVERTFFLSTIYHNLGGLEHARRRYRRAEGYARKGLKLRLQCSTADSLAVASDRAALAAILDGLRCYPESLTHYRYALRIYRRECGPSEPELAVVLNNLGALYQATGKFKRAEMAYRATLRIKRERLGASHPDIAVTMNNLAMLYQSRGKNRLAQLWFNKALRILAASLGSSHPNTRAVRRNHRRLARAA